LEKSGDNHSSNARRRWAVLLVMAGGLLWLNGPGLRWLGPKVARHFLENVGMRGSFMLDGSLSGGLSVRNFHLESDGPVARLTVDLLKPDYRLKSLIKGSIDGIKVNALHLDLRLDSGTKTPDLDKKPLDLEDLTRSLRAARERFIPLELDLENASLTASRNGGTVFTLAPSSIRHKAGEAEIDVRLGAITDATGRRWPERDSSIVWNEDALAIDHIDPLPGVAISNLTVRLPVVGPLSMECMVHIGDAGFAVDAAPGLSSVQVNLMEGALTSETVERFGLKLPMSGTVTSFSSSVENLFPNPGAATGSLRVFVENISHAEWKLSELSMDATLEAARASVAARASAQGAELSLDADAGVARGKGSFQLGDARGKLRVPEVPALVSALAGRIKAIDPAAPVPQASMAADFKIGFSDNRPQSAEMDLSLNPVDPAVATAVSMKAIWHPDQPDSAELATDGAEARMEYDSVKSTYQGRLELNEFKSARIDPWLNVVKAGTGGAIMLTGDWKGGGSIRENRHKGEMDLKHLDLSRDGAEPLQLLGGIEYSWPGRVVTHGLQVRAGTQQISGDLRMENGLFHLSGLVWKDGETELASGSAELPVPKDPSKWREMLTSEERPLSVSLATKELRLSGLADWIPDLAKLDPRATGSAMLKISGTSAKPIIDAEFKLKDLRMNDRKELPPADLELRLAARDDRLSLEGNMTVPKLPPAVISASMPFHPAEWAADPELLAGEKISARMDLPRVDLSRFTAMVPAVSKLSGTLDASLEAAGEIRMPVLKGGINLANAALELKRGDFPSLAGLNGSVDLSREKITLRGLKATMAGGTLTTGGYLTLENGKPAALDLRVKGDHVPVKRDESLIIRANADLRLSGEWESAALTGSIGAVDGIFYRDIEILPIGSPFIGPSAASLPKFDTPAKPADVLPEPFRSWSLNVVVLTENPFLIRGNLATGKIVGRVRVGGTFGTPRPDGEVKISDLRASLPFSTLEVRNGILRFTPENGFDPALEIRGSAEQRPYRVGMFVYGRASDPQLLLTSSPPLPENEIMTLLATGTTTSGLEDPQMASSRALQLFAEEIRRGRFVVGKQLRPLLGLLDRVDFSVAEADPYSSESYSTATLRLTDRWYLSAGMGGEGDSRLLGIWRLRFY
jgi:hypothetical protein